MPGTHEKAPFQVLSLFGSGGRIRTLDLQVMSSNPEMVGSDRQAHRLRVARRSAFLQSLTTCMWLSCSSFYIAFTLEKRMILAGDPKTEKDHSVGDEGLEEP